MNDTESISVNMCVEHKHLRQTRLEEASRDLVT